MTSFYNFLTEAGFSGNKLNRVSELYAKLMGKSLSTEFKHIGTESYKRGTGTGNGIRYMSEMGDMLRFNWDDKLAKTAKNDLTSIDYWERTNKNFEKPSRTLVINAKLNVVEIYKELGAAIRGDSTVSEGNLSAAERSEWLVSKGIGKSHGGSERMTRLKAEEKGLLAEYEVFVGKRETNSFEDKLKAGTKKSEDKKIYADPDLVFQDIEELTSVIATKRLKSLIICGQGGVGKTWHVTNGKIGGLEKVLGPEGNAWIYHSGAKAAPMSFYRILFSERDKVIVFDEADSLLKNEDIVMMLKPILDTSGNNMAEYLTNTENMLGKSASEIEDYCLSLEEEIANGATLGIGKNDVKLPSKFKFTGSMIFISNMQPKEIESAILSRSLFVNVYLSAQDMMKRNRSIARHSASDYNMTVEEMDALCDDMEEGLAVNTDEIITYMSPEYARKSKDATVRSILLAATLKQAGIANYKRLASLYS